MCFSSRGLTQLHESYTRRADTGVNEAADAAELAADHVARKQTNKGRATEELAKHSVTAAQQHAADATEKRWLLLRRKPQYEPDKQRSC